MRYTDLHARLLKSPLAQWADVLVASAESSQVWGGHGDLSQWQKALDMLPPMAPGTPTVRDGAICIEPNEGCSEIAKEQLAYALKQMHPWRKGPWRIYGVDIDTEWRSDFKWNRLDGAIQPLKGRTVLDVGCGNGYHCWRMTSQDADLVLGIDPTLVYVLQYFAIRRFIKEPKAWVLPIRMEHMPKRIRRFDTVFSMGVLYHRRSPIDHLLELWGALRSGGQLVLETLVLDEPGDRVLVPEKRYARMKNVWFLPTLSSLFAWLKKTHFTDLKIVDVTTTTTQEQRATEWMTFESLDQALDPDDPSKTIEGYPAPTRAIVTATAT
ncbi:MAG: tRNA 5-methoxyuridine(34)/uridine 5-oxyacetic acid(34) synthase CmoB [Pseudomonadota bacterium]